MQGHPSAKRAGRDLDLPAGGTPAAKVVRKAPPEKKGSDEQKNVSPLDKPLTNLEQSLMEASKSVPEPQREVVQLKGLLLQKPDDPTLPMLGQKTSKSSQHPTHMDIRYLQRKRGPSVSTSSAAPSSPPVAKAPTVKQKLPSPTPSTLPAIHHHYEDDEDSDSDEDDTESGSVANLFGHGVLGKVIEKDVSIYNVQAPTTKSAPKGFPEAKHRTELPTPPPSSTSSTHPLLKMFLSQQSGDVPQNAKEREEAEIHQKNLEVLSSMSKEEIRAEQESLRQMFDPKVLAALKKRGEQKMQKNVEPLQRIDTEMVTREELKHLEQMEVKNITATPNLVVDALEAEKMAWIYKEPPPAPMTSDDVINMQRFSDMRFDFEGRLIPVTEGLSIPTHAGLHHHGDAPQVAGYNIKELFHLARASVPSQRTIALQTLTRIVELLWKHSYTPLQLTLDIANHLLDCHVGVLARSALDDQNPNALNAAVCFLHSLLIGPQEEHVYEISESSFRGNELFPLVQMGGAVAAETESNTDAEVARNDLVIGLLRMGILLRIRYLVQVQTTNRIDLLLDVIVRIVRHSQVEAKNVFECPKLLDMIRKEYLEPARPGSREEGQKVFSRAHLLAVRLFLHLAKADRSIAQSLHKDGLLVLLQRFIVSDCGHDLFVESIRTWRVFASYGFDCSAFVDLFSIVSMPIATFQLDQSNLSNLNTVTNLRGRTCAQQMREISAVFQLCESLMSAANSVAVSFSHMLSFIQPAIAFLNQLKVLAVDVFAQSAEIRTAVWQFAATLFSLFSTFLEHFPAQNSFNSQQVAELCRLHFLPFFESNFLFDQIKLLMGMLEKCSPITFDFVPPFRSHQSFQSTPSLEDDTISGLSFVSDFSRVVLSLMKVQKEVAMYFAQGRGGRITSVLFQLLLGIQSKISPQNSAAIALFAIRSVVFSQYHILMLLSRTSDADSWKELQLCAVNAIARLLPGDECYFADLSVGIVFAEKEEPRSAIDPKRLRSLQEFYLARFCHDKAFGPSLSLIRPTDIIASRQSLRLPIESSLLPCEIDWNFSALNDYHRAVEQNLKLPTGFEERVLDELLFAELLQLRREQHPRIPIGCRPTRLVFDCLKVFLIDNEFFLNENVSGVLDRLLELSVKNVKSLPFEKEGIRGLFHFVLRVVEQFVSVSFGEKTFSRFLQLFLRMEYVADFRKLIFRELSSSKLLSALRFEPPLSLRESFLVPIESNAEVLNLYAKAIADESLTKENNSFLYWVVVHHLSAAIFLRDANSAEDEFSRLALSLPKAVVRDLIHYSPTLGTIPFPCVEDRVAMLHRWKISSDFIDSVLSK